MTFIPATQLVKKWAETINTVTTEVQTIRDRKTKKALILVVRKLRVNLLVFYGLIKWWKSTHVTFKCPDINYVLQISNEDIKSYTFSITRSLALDIWWILEYHYRGTSKSGIKKILLNRFNNKIPPSIDALRLIKNCFHNGGIHTGRDSDRNVSLTINAKTYHFREGKPIKHFHPLSILELIDDVVIRLIQTTQSH